jgi:hypothetical protein
MYQDMYQRLSHNLPAVPPAASFPDMGSAPRFGVEQVSPPQASRAPLSQPMYSSLPSGKTLPPSMGGPGSRSTGGRR